MTSRRTRTRIYRWEHRNDRTIGSVYVRQSDVDFAFFILRENENWRGALWKKTPKGVVLRHKNLLYYLEVHYGRINVRTTAKWILRNVRYANPLPVPFPPDTKLEIPLVVDARLRKMLWSTTSSMVRFAKED